MSDPSKPTRRQFLQGKAAADSLQNIFEEPVNKQILKHTDHSNIEQGGEQTGGDATLASEKNSAAAEIVKPHKVSFSRQAMACTFEILLNLEANSDAAAIEALDRIDELEQILSVYRDTSEITHVNQQAHRLPLKTVPEIIELSKLAISVYNKTEGAFDFTSGPLSQAWGFSQGSGKVPSKQQIVAALNRQGTHRIIINSDEETIHFLQADLNIHFNSIGKGYAIDQAAECLLQAGVEQFVIHGGQSSVRAAGAADTQESVTEQNPASGEDCERRSSAAKSLKISHSGWPIGLCDPLRSDQRLAVFHLYDRALGTSGSGRQFFRSGGRRYGHLLDPRTGWPAEGVYSSTVLAPSAALADALATAFYVLGPEKSKAILCRLA